MLETPAASISTPDFLNVLRASRLVDDSKLEAALRELDLATVSADDIAARLSELELLTSWHARQLLKGRFKGYRLGKYLLLDELGCGGMAKVFLARHETLRNLVAIKVLSLARMQKESMLLRFLREARAAAQISHANIVRVFDVDEQEGRHYLVMEYIRGRSVQDLVDEEGPLSFERAARFTLHAAEGLTCAHRAGLIHRDVKPANLLVEDGKTAKLSDFGLARAGAEEEDDKPSLTMQHDERVLGTADYIAPEQAINSHRVDARADQYSLGCTLYYMLTGQPPFPTGRIVERLTKHCTQEPEGVRTFRPDVPEELLQIVHKLTRKKPEERYPIMQEVADALTRFLARHVAGGSPDQGASASGVLRAQRPLVIQPSKTYTDDSDEILDLAPEDDAPQKKEAAGRALRAKDSATSAAQGDSKAALNAGQAAGKSAAVPALDSLGGGLFDDLLNDIPLAPLPAGPRPAGESGADVHGSDVLAIAGGSNPLRDTATSRALPTGAADKPAASSAVNRAAAKSAATQPGMLAAMYQRALRGEYPLWLLVLAGLIFGGLIILLAWSFLSSFGVTPPPVKWNTE
jgi:serine/threonine protein kinase